MSLREEKHLGPLPSTSTPARRSLASLRCARGYRVHQEDGGKPVLVSVCPMDVRTWWQRVGREEFEQVEPEEVRHG